MNIRFSVLGGNIPVPVKSLNATSHSLSATMRNRLLKRNATIIIQNSTALPFKWHRQLYLCFYCNKPFQLFNDLREHTYIEHDTANVKSSISFLRMDSKVKIDVASWRCRLCDYEPNNVDAMVDHLKVVHNKHFEDAEYGVIPYKHLSGSYDCAVCDKSFAYFMKLNQHMNTHFGRFVCDACGKSFLSSDRLRSHALLHTGIVRCEHCTETFRSVSIKNSHINKVHVSKVKCPHCVETFSNYNQRKVHFKVVHNVGSLHACPDCGKEFSCNSRMEHHLKEVHYKETHFNCNMCDQRFYSNWRLTKHVRITHSGKEHKCGVCHKSFARSSTLNEHVKTHSDNNILNCEGIERT